MDRKAIKQLTERVGSVSSKPPSPRSKFEPTSRASLSPSAIKKPGKLNTTKGVSTVKAPLEKKTSFKIPDLSIPMPQMKMPKVKTIDDKKEVSRTGASARVGKVNPDVKSAVKSRVDNARKLGPLAGPPVGPTNKKKLPKPLETTDDLLKILKSKPDSDSSDDTTSDSESSDEGKEISSYLKKAGVTSSKLRDPLSKLKGKSKKKKSFGSSESEDSEIEAARELKKMLDNEEFAGLDLDKLLKETRKSDLEHKGAKPGYYTKKSQDDMKRPINPKPGKDIKGRNVFSDEEDDESDYDEHGMIDSLVIPQEIQSKYQNMMKKKVEAVGRTASPLHSTDEEKYGEEPKSKTKSKNKGKQDSKEAVISSIMSRMEMHDDETEDDLLDMLNDVSTPAHKSVRGDAEDSIKSLRQRLYAKHNILDKTNSAISTMSQKTNKDKKPPMYSKKHQDMLADLTSENWSSKINTLTKDIEKAKAKLASGDDKDPFMSDSMRKFYNTIDESVKMANTHDSTRKATLRSKEFKDMLKHLKDEEPRMKTSSKSQPKTKAGKAAEESPLASGDRLGVRRQSVSKVKN